PSTAISTLSLHDALPISLVSLGSPRLLYVLVQTNNNLSSKKQHGNPSDRCTTMVVLWATTLSALKSYTATPDEPNPNRSQHKSTDRKSTRLNSSHVAISY